MDITGDELAGVVDLFGGLTSEELSEAMAELAYRQGDDYDPEAYEPHIREAIQSYHLVALDGSGDADSEAQLLCAGPLAFPSLPPDADDLPHILDIEPRTVETDRISEQVTARFRREAREAIRDEQTARIETLLDASYELEPWAGIDLSEIRSALAEKTPTS